MAVSEDFKGQVAEALDELGYTVESAEETVDVENVGDDVTLPGYRRDAQGRPAGYVSLKLASLKAYLDNVLASVRTAWDTWFGADGNAGVRRTWTDWFGGRQSEWDTLSQDAQEATAAASAASQAADESRASIEANEQARQSSEQERQSNEQDRVAQESSRVTEFENLRKLSEAATALASDVAMHPTYVDDSGWVYEYSPDVGAYNKTDKNIHGRNFTVDKVFSSVEEMTAYGGDKLKEGYFFMVNTGSVEDEDTARLYIVQPVDGRLQPVFLVDMSGARGFTGHTPQITVGMVTTGAPDSPAAASLSANGEDAAGNPKFLLNLTIPKGDTFRWADLTEGNILELQRPAIEAGKKAEQQGNKAQAQGEKTEQQGNAAEAQGAVAMQQGETAEAQGNAAETKGNTAQQQGETAERQGNVAEGKGNTAQQQGNTAQEQGEAAEAQGNTAQNKGSIAEQKGNAAEQQGNTAETQGNTAQQKGNAAEANGLFAQQQGSIAKNMNDHPPYIGDDNYWHVWDYDGQQYRRESYARGADGADLNYDDMTDEEKEDLAGRAASQMLRASVETCEAVIDELV